MSKNTSSGFTLIELLIVVAIISILSVIGLVAYGNFLKNSRDAKRQADLKFIQSALEDYHADQIYYPTTITFGSPLTNLIGRPTQSPTPNSKTYLNSVPSDPKPPPYNNYSYVPSPAGCNNTSPNYCTSYCLYAKLEGTDLADDQGCTPSSPYNFGVTRP